MKDFKDKVAVITGAASGIGKGLAERCIQEGMKVVLSDIEEKTLKETEEELKSKGHIVNTGSIAGFLSYYFSAPYQVTKHAVTALTENLHHSLTGMESKIKVSLLCPA